MKKLSVEQGGCPKCGAEIRTGYGLAGGGIGPYTYCETEGCDFFEKTQEGPEDFAPPRPPPADEESSR